MTSSSSTSSEENKNLQKVMEQRKRKRMISNRESARRSRIRKQKLLDDLTAEIAQLKKENQRMITSVSITTQHYLTIESDNSILRAQQDELKYRLDSLNDIINGSYSLHANHLEVDDVLMNHMNINMNMNMFFQNQPLMASPHVLQY